MDYEISLSKDERFGILTLSRPIINKESAIKIYNKVVQYKIEHHLSLFLCDARLVPLQASNFEQYDFVYNQIHQLDPKPCRKVALITSKGDRSYNFIEVLFYNTGHIIKLFDNLEEATAWLLDTPQ
jgi:hypothetical protein